MRFISLSIIILLVASANAFAQKSIFKMYRFESSELFDINLTKPKGFKVIDGKRTFAVNEKMNIGTLYQVTLESKAKDCLILYPWFMIFKHHEMGARNMVYGEVEAALNIPPDNKTIKLDTAKYVKIIAKNDMKSYFNADTVFIYKIKLPKPYKEVYSECIGINTIKNGHPSAMIKILLTEEGIKKEDEYMQTVFKSMQYPDTAPTYNKEKFAEVRKKMERRFFYGKNKSKFIGYYE